MHFYKEQVTMFLSRIKEGVHFPSDNKFSVYLSEKVLLLAFIKILRVVKTNLE